MRDWGRAKQGGVERRERWRATAARALTRGRRAIRTCQHKADPESRDNDLEQRLNLGLVRIRLHPQPLRARACWIEACHASAIIPYTGISGTRRQFGLTSSPSPRDSSGQMPESTLGVHPLSTSAQSHDEAVHHGPGVRVLTQFTVCRAVHPVRLE